MRKLLLALLLAGCEAGALSSKDMGEMLTICKNNGGTEYVSIRRAERNTISGRFEVFALVYCTDGARFTYTHEKENHDA